MAKDLPDCAPFGRELRANELLRRLLCRSLKGLQMLAKRLTVFLNPFEEEAMLRVSDKFADQRFVKLPRSLTKT